MHTELVPLFPRLEAAAVHGPGKHELARIFFAHQKRNAAHPVFTLTDSYGRVWIKATDFEKVRELVIPSIPSKTIPN